jgi:hypothetical protein
MEILMFLAGLAGGFGCGFHVRDRISKKRRERYRSSTRDRTIAKPRLLDFKTIRTSDVWLALRNLPPIQ